MTLNAQVEIATWNTTNVTYGLTAAQMPLALMGKDIVMITPIVTEHSSVAMTIVQVDQQEWTAAQMMVKWNMFYQDFDMGVWRNLHYRIHGN